MKNLRGAIVIPIGTKIFCWEVIGEPESYKHGGLQFLCRCACGIVKTVQGKSLRCGESKSCGCGMCTPDMKGWQHELQKCDLCRETFTSYRSLILHIKRQHLKKGERYCSHCREIKPISSFTSQDILCKACRKENAKLHYDPTDLNRRYNQARLRAIRRKHGWDLTFDEFIDLIAKPCHYCGKPTETTGVGLDRKNNENDYRITTVVPCCRRCNTMKSDLFSYGEMMLLSEVVKKIDHDRELQCF